MATRRSRSLRDTSGQGHYRAKMSVDARGQGTANRQTIKGGPGVPMKTGEFIRTRCMGRIPRAGLHRPGHAGRRALAGAASKGREPAPASTALFYEAFHEARMRTARLRSSS